MKGLWWSSSPHPLTSDFTPGLREYLTVLTGDSEVYLWDVGERRCVRRWKDGDGVNHFVEHLDVAGGGCLAVRPELDELVEHRTMDVEAQEAYDHPAIFEWIALRDAAEADHERWELGSAGDGQRGDIEIAMKRHAQTELYGLGKSRGKE